MRDLLFLPFSLSVEIPRIDIEIFSGKEDERRSAFGEKREGREDRGGQRRTCERERERETETEREE